MNHGLLNLSSRRLADAAATGGRGRHLFDIDGSSLAPLLAPGGAGELFAVLLAVFDILLLRYIGSDDFTAAGRKGKSETLPLRIGLADYPTFSDLLERVRHGIQSGGDPGGTASGKAILVLSGELPEESQYDLALAFTESKEGL